MSGKEAETSAGQSRSNGKMKKATLEAELQTQLELQRRILASVADRDREIRELRSDLGRNGEHVYSASAQETIRALDRQRADLRGRLLDARDRILRLEEDVRSGPGLPGRAAPGTESRERAASVPGLSVGSPRAPDSFAACTIISRNYLAQARVLIDSLREHEPQVRFYLLVVDGLPRTESVEGDVEAVTEAGSNVVLIDYRELPVPEPDEMPFKYGIVEFNTAVKPYLLALLMEKYGEEAVVYFDPDICVQRPLDELRSALGEGDIVLTPHITQPIPLDGLSPSEPDIMISGAYNLGFIALRRSEESLRFLRWWEERLEDGCRIDVPNGLFTDQKWIDLVPGLFPATHILRDQAYNIAFWNLHERSIAADSGRYLVNGRPAAFFHISGFNPEAPDLLSKHQTRTRVEEHPALARLLSDYAERLLKSGAREAREWEYGFSRFDNGVGVHDLLRRLYLDLTPGQRRAFGDPFHAGGEDCFLEWATRPRDELGGLSYFLDAVYRARVDLADAFPDVRGRDRDMFFHWARTQGPIEMGYEPGLVRDPADAVDPAEPPGATDRPLEAVDAGLAAEASPGVATSADPPLDPTADPRHYQHLVDRIRAAVDEAVPTGATLSVVSRGDYRLTHQGARQAWHFPRTEQGLYVGYHPRDSKSAIEHLETQRSQGADYFVLPATAGWWLDFYSDFRSHLEDRYQRVVDRPDLCVIYSLQEDSHVE